MDTTGPRLAMLPIFMLAVSATILIIRALRRRARAVLAIVLGLEALALGVFLLLGVLLEKKVGGDQQGWAVVAIGAAGVTAMGIQNALMRELLATSATTMMMTGNVTQFTIDLTRWLLAEPGDSQRAEARKQLAKTGGVLLGFVCGAALGALGMRHSGFFSLAIPMAVVGVLAALEGRAR
jgi:uncharacterized membrane protein YoaK (UPF0700 family)